MTSADPHTDERGCKDSRFAVHSMSAGNLSDRQLGDLLYQGTHVINVPVLNPHGGENWIPVSLGLKNHLVSLGRVVKNFVKGPYDDL